MRVKLLEDRVLGPGPKVYLHKNRGYQITARKGAVLEVSEATGKKWIDAKKAVVTTEAETREPLPKATG
jgi:hypothetical protein